MKFLNVSLSVLIMIVATTLTAYAGDFDWLKQLNIQATSDSSGFRARLETRFRVGDAEIKTVFSNVDRPADAYMVLRLGELSHQPVATVVEQYRMNKNRGWGVMAKNLGIKPGSREFHALKAGHDLSGNFGGGAGKGGGGNQSQGGGHGHGKNKKHK